ncbi:MBL fold metallo-hydrolase [Glacieibacterium megasporae]|uniref:MBL fold metallo-hydrolase n=1 Tax=Glacieibacterium megasporae TaxID=2835787 RepID=UPI001C1E7553|nr:MBL fold metallo-hydrolase [Polymorphobacter megasporae]UAJ09384.1 MBL fold metallo-hydrolase [Polymorphobacter megasporae]
MKVTILGSGTSSGVPRIGNDWGYCDPAEPKNRRRRVSLLVEHDGATIVIDTGPDFREQMLAANVQRLDAVLYTHDHADHTHGIDDLRQFFHLMKEPVACYASPVTWDVLIPRFSYVFAGTAFYPASATANPMPPILTVGGINIRSFNQNHGNIDSLGFRIETAGKAIAYSTDVKVLPPESEAFVQGLDLWVVDALRQKPHPTHSHLDQTLGWIAKAKPRHTILTHMDNSMDYAALARSLPDGIEPGFDGQTITI